jgi:hypothetical protein
VIKPRKNKSVKTSRWLEPSIEFLNYWYVIINNILADNRVSLFKHRDSTRYGRLSTLIIEDISLTVIKVLDSNTVNSGNVVEETVSFDVEE